VEGGWTTRPIGSGSCVSKPLCGPGTAQRGVGSPRGHWQTGTWGRYPVLPGRQLFCPTYRSGSAPRSVQFSNKKWPRRLRTTGPGGSIAQPPKGPTGPRRLQNIIAPRPMNASLVSGLTKGQASLVWPRSEFAGTDAGPLAQRVRM
jgi:hypothetical protein